MNTPTTGRIAAPESTLLHFPSGYPVAAPDPHQAPPIWKRHLHTMRDDALLLLIPPAAGADKAREIDAELLACCADADEIDRQASQALNGIEQGDDEGWNAAIGAGLALVADWHRLVRRAAKLPARTPEGLLAKAGLVNSYLRENEDAAGIGLSLARDILGRAAQ